MKSCGRDRQLCQEIHCSGLPFKVGDLLWLVSLKVSTSAINLFSFDSKLLSAPWLGQGLVSIHN